jgi:Holliday junction resolvase RusA-like endonuclease
MPQTIALTLIGEPMPKGRPRAFKDGRGNIRAYTPDKTAHAENSWRDLFRGSNLAPLAPGTPLAVTVFFYLTRPPSIPKKRTRPIGRPDVDNLVKLVTDALEGLAYERDAAIVSIAATKEYVTYPDPPRTEIYVKELGG